MSSPRTVGRRGDPGGGRKDARSADSVSRQTFSKREATSWRPSQSCEFKFSEVRNSDIEPLAVLRHRGRYATSRQDRHYSYYTQPIREHAAEGRILDQPMASANKSSTCTSSAGPSNPCSDSVAK